MISSSFRSSVVRQSTNRIARRGLLPAISGATHFQHRCFSTTSESLSTSPAQTSSKAPSAAQSQRRWQSAAAAAQMVQQAPMPELSDFSEPNPFKEAPMPPKYAHHITLVKKIKADGSPCRKCVDVQQRIEREGFSHRMDRIVIADEGNPMSEGMQMAKHFGIKTAPFFLVDSNIDKDEPTLVYNVYFKLKREILAKDLSESEKLKDIQDSPQVQELVDFV